MDAQIVFDVVDDIIKAKIEWARKKGIYRANYDELVNRLTMCGYSEAEIQTAIRELVATKRIKCGKDDSGKGWLRDYREIDKNDDLRPQ